MLLRDIPIIATLISPLVAFSITSSNSKGLKGELGRLGHRSYLLALEPLPFPCSWLFFEWHFQKFSQNASFCMNFFTVNLLQVHCACSAFKYVTLEFHIITFHCKAKFFWSFCTSLLTLYSHTELYWEIYWYNLAKLKIWTYICHNLKLNKKCDWKTNFKSD